MALKLFVATYQNLPPSRPMSKEFAPAGGTIGRAPNNDFILPDPLQYVSRVQARVESRDGAWFIVDQGRNPTVLNGKPIGTGQERKLNDGDRLVIGDYGVAVQIEPRLAATSDVSPLRTGASQPAARGELLGDSDVFGSVRPIGDSIEAFGLNLGGGGSDAADGAEYSMLKSANQLVPSGTQRDHLPDINSPLPPARPKLDSSLLNGLDADVSMPQSKPAPREPGSVLRESKARTPIPDDFNPFTTPGVRKADPVLESSKPSVVHSNGMGAPPKVAAIPDDFDPFAERDPQPKEQSVPPARPADVRPVAKPPTNSSAPAGAGPSSLLDGFDDVSTEPPPRPGQTATPPAPPQRSPVASPDPLAQTVPMEKPTAAALQAACGESQPHPASSTEEAIATGYARALRELVSGAGVPELAERMTATVQPMQRVGQVLRMVIVGLQRVLEARRLTKHEMRVDMTMVLQRRNNPLKLAPDATEALMHLLTPRGGDVYLPPDEAIIEAFEDLQAHHLAVMAGMRAALQGVLRRYDPAQLERKLQTHALLDKVLPMNRKAKMWDLLTDLHNQIQRESEDEFERLFGQHFRTAYEEQVRKLRGMRKPK